MVDNLEDATTKSRIQNPRTPCDTKVELIKNVLSCQTCGPLQ